MTEDDIKALCYSAEIATLKQRVEALESGPGGIMEMKQTIADKEALTERLRAALQRANATAEEYERKFYFGNDRIEELEAELRYATEYAGRLAVALSKQHYPEAYEFKLVPDLLGIIDQIDHMTYGMIRIGTQSNDTFEVK